MWRSLGICGLWHRTGLVLCVVLLVSVAVEAAQCTSNLTRVEIPTLGNTTTCADGSAAVYYYAKDTNVTSRAFVIWLGEGAICGTKQQCDEEYLLKTKADSSLCDDDGSDVISSLFDDPNTEAEKGRCYAVKLQHTSTWTKPDYEEIRAETLLCGDADSPFKNYHRIYVPSCTLDWWVGNGSDSNTADHYLWRGSRVLDSLFQNLSAPPFSITTATQVVLGGTGGGGVGVINNFARLRSSVLSLVPDVRALVDSAYFVNVERFANLSKVFMGPGEVSFKLGQDLHDRTREWGNNSIVDAECKTFWGDAESSRCLFISEVLKRPTMQNQRVMIIQSQYDLAALSQLDLFNLTLTSMFADNASYAQNAVNFVENYGSETRRSIEAAGYFEAGVDNLFFFSPACGQYGYLPVTDLQVVPRRSVDLGKAGSLSLQRDDEVWTTVEIDGTSVQDAVVAFVNSSDVSLNLFPSDRHNIRADRCGSFLCNPQCTNSINSFRLETIWGPCSQRLVVAYCLIMLGSFWFVFIIAAGAVCIFRRRTSSYWERVVEKEEKEFKMDPEMDAKYRDQAEEELIRDAFASARRVHLMVRKLNYWAPPRKSGKAYQILRNVSAAFPAGKVHALMGPSGSGKSTLLDMVALTRDTGIITGSHYVNGVDSFSSKATFLRQWLRHNVSYVKQQDNMFPLLTVREHLTHSAWLMLPEFMDNEAKLRRVWQVIKLMGLEKAAETICGDGGVEVEGGISGGQRRRVSVATQLLKLPACLVLDEPTSGLDATNALTLVKTLHTLAHRGGTNVIMTIHQPRKEIFRFLDNLKILVGGRILFSGMPKDAFDHFEVSRRLNIGDEVLDQLGKAQLEAVLAYQKKYEEGPLGKAVDQEMATEVVLDFNSELAAQLEYTLTTNALADGRWSWTESSSAPMMMYVLLSRTIKRGGFDVQKTITISLLGGVLVGLVFLGGTESFRRHVSMAYLAVATMTFLQGTFIGDRYWAEKFMYTFESEAGTARPWISFLASMFCRLIVASTTEALAFAVPLFFLGMMNNQDNQIRFYLLILVMCAVATATQYLLVEIYFMKPDDKRTGALVNMALLSMSALFNGFIIQLQDLPVYLVWLPLCMLSYWSFVGVLINDLSGFTITCEASPLECSARTGDAIVRGLQYDNRDVFQCLFALLIMVGIFLLSCVLVFFFKWVSPMGNGIKRRTSSETREQEQRFLERAKEIAITEGVSGNTMTSVLKEGKNLQKQKSADKLVRSNSTEGGMMTRNNSTGTLSRNDSFGSPEQGSNRKVLLNPAPSSPDLLEQNSFKSQGSGGEEPPPFEKQNSLQNTGSGLGGENGDNQEFVVKESCCSHDRVFVKPFMSRILLVCYYILDFIAASSICNGQENVFVGEFNSTSEAIGNVTDILGSLGSNLGSIDADGVNVVFVILTAVFLIGYVVQFVIQFLFLFPRDVDNRINPCTRIALLDILGAAFIAGDFILLFILIGAGRGAQLQIYLLVAIRIIRGLRVMSFWYKISAFHELRVVAYLEYKLMLMGEYDPTAYGENVGNDLGDSDLKPEVPSRDTKPQVDLGSLRNSGKKEDLSFFRRAVASIRVPAASTENRRASLQRRVSIANKRMSSRIPAGGIEAVQAAANAHAASGTLVPPSRPIPPVAPPGLMRPPGMSTSSTGQAPIVPPRPPVLPASMRINLHGPSMPPSLGIPGLSAGAPRMAAGAPRVANASTAGPGAGMMPRGPPPPVPPRTGASLAGFGITPGALQLMQGQRPYHQQQTQGGFGAYRARKDEPSMDEI